MATAAKQVVKREANVTFIAPVQRVIEVRNATLTFGPDGLLITPNDETVLYEGYAGGGGGSAFADGNIGTGTVVTSVLVRNGSYIDALQLVLQTSGGQTITSPQHGKDGGHLDVFPLSANEYLTSIEGRFGDYVDSMTLVTNTGRRSPAFGGGGGSKGSYVFQVPDGFEIIGFAGRAGDYIDQIGIAFRQRGT